MNIASFTAASTIPAKLFCDMEALTDISINKHVRPLHIQVNPTNTCPLSCTFCSCTNRDKSLELNFEQLKAMTDTFILMGTKAVTITGGGDPLAYSKLPDYVQYLDDHDTKIGLVTNGVLYKPSDAHFMSMVTWCRVSLSDEYNLLTPKLQGIIKASHIDWSFSYVIMPDTKIENIIKAIEFANENDMTHVRLVDDILDEKVPSRIASIKEKIQGKTDDSRVIYQGRKTYTKGNKKCLISLLKPNIGPDGNIYPCCGIQYAKNPPALDLRPEDSIGNISQIKKIWNTQKCYDGSACEKCFYSDYNNILNIVENSKDLQHKEFI